MAHDDALAKLREPMEEVDSKGKGKMALAEALAVADEKLPVVLVTPETELPAIDMEKDLEDILQAKAAKQKVVSDPPQMPIATVSPDLTDDLLVRLLNGEWNDV